MMNEASHRAPAVGETRPGHARGVAEVPAIDGLRGIAALLVLFFHCWVFLDPPLGGGALRALVAAGDLGVDFFFVISGFVLFLPVVLRAGSFGDVRAYALRRVARIVPAYYLSLVVQGLAVRWLTGFPVPFASRGGWLVFGAHLLFLQHLLPASLARAAGFWGNVVGFGVNGVVWSLSIEALFYVTLPLIAGRFFRRPIAGLLIAVATSLAWRLFALSVSGVLTDEPSQAPGPPRLLLQYPSFFAHFAFGMCGALLYVRATRSTAPSRRLRWLLPAQLVLLAALAATMIAHGQNLAGASIDYSYRLADFLPALAFAVLLTLASIAPRGLLRALTWPRVRWLGDVSYGVFLWHLPLVLLVRHTRLLHEKSDLGFVVLCAIVLPTSLLIGWLSRRYVEEPVILWARRRTRR